MGTYDEKFANALDAIKPSWAPEVKSLLKFLEFDHHQRPPLVGRPPVVASLPEDAPRGPSAELPGPFGDLWVFGEARGATTIEVTVRGTAKLEIDVRSQRWKVSGLRGKGGEGMTIPLRDGAAAFALEMHKDRLLAGVGGALVASTFEGLPPKPGPVRVRCAGEGAEVTRLVAYEKHALTLADHASALLDKPDNVEAIEEVRALESRGAAFTLAIVASLSGKNGGGAASEALQGMGEVAADFRAALGIDKAAPGPRFVRRSFAEVCKSFAALSPKKKLRKGEVHGREAVSFGDPASPTSKRGEAVPSPALYLSTDGMIHEPAELVDTIAGLPALTKGWGQCARVSAAVSPDEYLLVALEITPPEYEDDALFYECLGAIWPVDEGHVIAVWDTDRKKLAQVMGMRALPTELEWNDLDDEIMLGE